MKTRIFKASLHLKILSFAFLLSPFALTSQVLPEYLYSRAERTNFQETSLNADVVKFTEALKQICPLARVEDICTTKLGNPVKLVILANPAVNSPEEAKKSGKPVIYIQGNIHSGEVEGKEATMQLMREIALGPKKQLLDNQIILFCPNYNPDGNDKLGENRPSQEGSPKLTGVRPNGDGLDLNREGMKAEATEMKGLLSNVFNRWDPVLFMDLHTDNGSWHGYIDNVAPAFQTAAMPEPTNYTYGLLKDAMNRVWVRSGLPVFWHGYLSMRPNEQATFTAYDHLPRYIANYVGLRNRMGILSEAFPHDHFEKRVLSNYYLVMSVLEYTNEHAKEIREMIDRADQETIDLVKTQAGTLQRGVHYELAAEPETITMLIRQTEPYTPAGSTRQRYRPTGKLGYVENVKHSNHFVPTLMSTVPRAYIFPAELKNVADKLTEHGIMVKTLDKKIKVEGEEFIINKFTQNQREGYGGHKVVSLEGSFKPSKKSIPAGSYYVDLAQPLAWLAFYLLEPQSDDGLVYWNYFDEYLLKQGVDKGNVPYPVLKTNIPIL
jgi:dipeptidyl-peptidase-4